MAVVANDAQNGFSYDQFTCRKTLESYARQFRSFVKTAIKRLSNGFE